MNIHNPTSQKAWPAPKGQLSADESRAGWTQYDVDRWVRLTNQVREIGERNGFSLAETARRMDMPGGTFSQWYHGNYAGRLDEQNKKAALWIEAMEEAGALTSSLVPHPGFIMTRTAREFQATLQYAHQLKKLVIVTASGGLGKTFAFENYCATRPHTFLVTASPYTKTVFGILSEIADVLGVREHNPAKRARAIGEFLARSQAPTLLIIDEAQNLSDGAVDQIRHFVDIYKIGVALGGNTEIYGRFSQSKQGPSYAQIKRRVAKRIKRERPYAEDVDAVLASWKITDEPTLKYLTGIAKKDGAIGTMVETITLAHLLASGDDSELQLKHVQAAWKDRDLEGF